MPVVGDGRRADAAKTFVFPRQPEQVMRQRSGRDAVGEQVSEANDVEHAFEWVHLAKRSGRTCPRRPHARVLERPHDAHGTLLRDPVSHQTKSPHSPGSCQFTGRLMRISDVSCPLFGAGTGLLFDDSVPRGDGRCCT